METHKFPKRREQQQRKTGHPAALQQFPNRLKCKLTRVTHHRTMLLDVKVIKL